jgi:signal transduction histidine kinase/ABC-type amino acid transport substrate-binding protein/BarA-like signal transduction histidine kinase
MEMMRMKKYKSGMLWCSLLLGLTAVLSAAMPISSAAAEPESAPETVRVGFFALDGYHEMDEDGKKSGYGYDFFHLTQKYVNLNYEYVGYDKSWEETLQMLLDGEIDIATSAYKTEERTELYDFSMPIGMSAIDINTRADETRFVPGDYSTYDGMTVGLLTASSENDMLEEFAEENGFSYRPKYYPNSAELEEALESKKVDAVATTSLRKIENEKVLSEFAMQEFYAVVKKGNTELLDKINYAITQLNSSEGDWKNNLYYDNYTANNYAEILFTEEEQSFIERYSTGGDKLVIALDNNWKPFSWKEGDEYKGILPDYLEACLEQCGMNYTFYNYEGSVFTADADSMKDVDIYACYGLPDDTEGTGLLASAPLLENGAAYLQRKDSETIQTIAISATNPNLNERITFDPGVTVVEYPDTEAAKQAVMDREVDAALLYGYNAEYTVNQDNTGKLGFTMLPNDPIEIRAVIGEDNDHTLMSILMKCINYMPDTQKTSIISKYVSFSVRELTIADYIEMHPVIFAGFCALIMVVLFVIVFILLKNRTERKYRVNLEEKVDEITNLNSQLKDNQEKLEETSAEQEAQLEEITALNNELEENQEKLEETYAEQEAQMEEIAALNNELEENQEKLEDACKQAEAANNAKTSFLFNMSHDIRTPMNAIIGFADLLEKHQEEPEKRADYLKKIQDSSTVLLSIINNVLEMARIEKGTLAIDEAAWSAEQFNDTLYSVFQDMMKQKEIEFTRKIEVEHQYVLCDPIKLREVFINILSNAYKYTNPGGKVHMYLKEIPSSREGYAMYQTTISDTGIGMAEDFLPHIFEEFSRENNTTDNKIEGTGLGMPIVKRLVEFMEGTIEVRSKKGEGSTFIVTIPHKITDRPELVEHVGNTLDVERFKGKRILLAEDNELNAEIAIEILTEVGFEVDRAEDGQACVDMLQRAGDFFYDVILMDIQMPNLNGYEATKVIRELPDAAKAEIPIIAMTANAFEEDKRDAQRAGMNGHLAKPVNVHELYKTLMGILE